MLNKMNSKLSVAALMTAAGAAMAGQPLVTIFAEDFESFPLTVNQEEGVETGTFDCVLEAFFGDGVQCGEANLNPNCGEPPMPALIDCGDFSNIPFDGLWSYNGWDQEFGYDWDGSGDSTPAQVGVGAAEWQGWSVADYDFWISADTQLREEFSKASGSLAIVDPDEWDDYDPFGIDPDSTGVFNARLTSPVIQIADVDANTVLVTFDSSWRPEDTQKVAMSVSFDGGAFTQILLWESDELSPDFHPDAVNETVNISIDNPSGASTMRVQWEMFDATNDWWWAIDNIEIAGQGGDPILPPSDFDLDVAMFNDTPVVPMSWTQSLNATSYDVVIANDAEFTDVVLSESTTELDFLTEASDLTAGVYFVKVVARNNLGTNEQVMQIGVDNSCPADLDGSGSLNFFDISRFLQIFSNG